MRKRDKRGSRGDGSLYKRGRVWWFKAPNGQCFSSGTEVKAEAVDFKQSKLAELRTDEPHVRAKVKESTVNELLDAHLAYMRQRRRASAQDVEWVMDKHIRPYFGARVAASLGTRDFEEYRELKSAEGLEPSTVNRHLSYLRSGYVTGYKRRTPRLVDFVPAFPIEDESYNVRKGFLTFEGYKKLLRELPVSLKPLLVCGYHVSSRKGELMKIRWSQVDLREGLIILDPFDTKNRTGRALPIYGDMMKVLTAQKKIRDEQFPNCEYVFFWHTEDAMIAHGGQRSVPGTPIRVFRKSWIKAVTAAGYPGLLFHDLRRTAERNMTKAGMDQAMRMKISGHKTPSMSLRYNIIVAADIAEERSKLDAWFRLQRDQQKGDKRGQHL